MSNPDTGDNFFQVSITPVEVTHKLPTTPSKYRPERWYGPGKTVVVAGRNIAGGMIYVGIPRRMRHHSSDACVIDPSKRVAKQGLGPNHSIGYWPHYSQLSPESRAVYLDWLASGRRSPSVDIGCVFLFFYGLERHILTETVGSRKASHWSAIRDEITELQKVYSYKSSSFNGYAQSLLTWMDLHSVQPDLYRKPIELPKGFTWEFPIVLRIALGQSAVDGVPLSPILAFQWFCAARYYWLRTPARRCPQEFQDLYLLRYQREFGSGMKVPRNKTRLVYEYRPASPTLSVTINGNLMQQELPDVTVLEEPISCLSILAESVTQELAPYSRWIGPDRRGADSIECQLQLPHEVWSTPTSSFVSSIQVSVQKSPQLIHVDELITAIGAIAPIKKPRWLAFARVLAEQRIAMEPDILRGAAIPKPEGSIVLYGRDPAEYEESDSVHLLTAMLTLQLSANVAIADDNFCDLEFDHLTRTIQSWTHLTQPQLRRLEAHLMLLRSVPVTLSTLKSKLTPLHQDLREILAGFMAVVAQSDGFIHPAEVKLLERAYKLLGVDPLRVFTNLHAVSVGDTLAGADDVEIGKGFSLDQARIEALQKDTVRVSSLLSSIFADDSSDATPVEATEVDEPGSDSYSGLLHLDETHSVLGRLLLSRDTWDRSELQVAASELEVMLDGALEEINDAAFEQYEIPFFEGDDPITINHELRERLQNE